MAGTWIKSPRGTEPGQCCECKPNVCDACAGCVTPVDCWTPDGPEGDIFAECGITLCAEPGQLFLAGADTSGAGTVLVCAEGAGCTHQIRFFEVGSEDDVEADADPDRIISILIDGVPMTITYELRVETGFMWWIGYVTIVIDAEECIPIEYSINSTLEVAEFWGLGAMCPPIELPPPP